MSYPSQAEGDIINAWIESGMTASWVYRPDAMMSSTITVLVNADGGQSRLGGYSKVPYTVCTKVTA